MGGIEFGMGELEKVGGALYLLVACSSASPVIGGQDDVVAEAAGAKNIKSGSLQAASLKNNKWPLWLAPCAVIYWPTADWVPSDRFPIELPRSISVCS